MVAGHGILLLIRGLMFLIDNHQSEVLEGQEHSTARAKDDIVRVLGELLLPDFHALGIGILGVVDAEAVAEDVL